MKQILNVPRKYAKRYKNKIPAQKRYDKMLKKVAPKGEDDNNWWLWSFLKGNKKFSK